MFFMFFYSKINVFIIYGIDVLLVRSTVSSQQRRRVGVARLLLGRVTVCGQVHQPPRSAQPSIPPR